MSIPTGTYRFSNKCAIPDTRATYGECPVGSPEAAYAIWKVQQYWRRQRGNYNRSAFTIKSPKPEPPEPVIPAGTKCCKRGHPQLPENVRIDRRGNNVCRSCDRERKTPKESKT